MAKAPITNRVKGKVWADAMCIEHAQKKEGLQMTLPYVEGLPYEQPQPINLIDVDQWVAIEQADSSGEEALEHCILLKKEDIDSFILRLQAMKKNDR